MSIFGTNRKTKVHHRLFFDQKTSNTPWPWISRERIAMFQADQSDSSHSTGEKTAKQIEGMKNGVSSEKNSMNSKGEMRQTIPKRSSDYYHGKRRKKSTPEELAIRKKNIEQSLKRRRDGVCSEIERGWFLQGAHLEKHRHNLQVTQKLMVRGLLWP